MKIHIIFNCYWSDGISGGDRRFLEIIRRWENSKNVSFIIYTSNNFYELMKKERITQFQVKLTEGTDRCKNIVGAYFLRARNTIRYLKKEIEDGDLIYSPTDILPDIYPAFYIKKQKQVNWSMISYHIFEKFYKRPGNLFINFLSCMQQRASILLGKYAADQILTTSPLVENYLKKYNVPENKIIRIDNAVDVNAIDRACQSSKKYDAIFLARLNYSKGIFELTRIWEIVVKKHPNAALGIIGSGSPKIVEKLKSDIRKRNLQKNAALLGYIESDKLYSIMKNSKLFLFTSHEEGWGMALAEALVCGLPVVAYDLPIYHFLFKEGLNLCKLKNVEEMAEKVIDLLENEEERITQGDKGREYIIEHYSLDNVAKKELDILQNECLAKPVKTKILSLSWRDLRSPTAGGAEVHTHQMLSYLDKNKFEVTHFSALYSGLSKNEVIDGIKYIRKGNVFSVILYAFFYYQKYKNNIDVVIGQCNTHQFFTPLWVHHSKRIFFINQLTREIWDINAIFPFNWLGKRLENALLKINRKDHVITISKSTKAELVKLGFDKDKIALIYIGLLIRPWKLDQMYEKEVVPTFIFVGRYSRYKGIDAAAEAVGRLRDSGIKAKLWIIGKIDHEFVDHELKPVCSRYGLIWGEDCKADLVSWGFVSEQKKLELLSRAAALVFPSIREGWGIPVTEAGVVGTPSIVYDSPGLRDAVDYGRAGFLCKTNDVDGLYNEMRKVAEFSDVYTKKRAEAYKFSSKFQFEKTGKRFENFLNQILCENVRL